MKYDDADAGDLVKAPDGRIYEVRSKNAYGLRIVERDDPSPHRVIYPAIWRELDRYEVIKQS